MSAYRDLINEIAVSALVGLFAGAIILYLLLNVIAVKANGDSGLYHLPHCPSYHQTQIGNHSDDRFFFKELSALEAGFQRANNCQ